MGIVQSFEHAEKKRDSLWRSLSSYMSRDTIKMGKNRKSGRAKLTLVGAIFRGDQGFKKD